MTVISSSKDVDALTLTFVAEFDAAVERVWQLWSDPRQLERWWGPPEWPATFTTYDFRPGGEARYHMTGPDGSTPAGHWRFTVVEAPRRLELADSFADESGEPVPGEPTHLEVNLDAVEGRTRMTLVSRFASVEQLAELEQLGMEEGMRQALTQIDALLA